MIKFFRRFANIARKYSIMKESKFALHTRLHTHASTRARTLCALIPACHEFNLDILDNAMHPLMQNKPSPLFAHTIWRSPMLHAEHLTLLPQNAGMRKPFPKLLPIRWRYSVRAAQVIKTLLFIISLSLPVCLSVTILSLSL